MDRQLRAAQDRLNTAENEEDFQGVGHLCWEVTISVAQAVSDLVLHEPKDGEARPSETDAKRMIESYIEHELTGAGSYASRRMAKSAVDAANSLQHDRNAEWRDAALLVEATTACVNIVAIIAGVFSPSAALNTSLGGSHTLSL